MPGAFYSSVKQFRVCEHCDWGNKMQYLGITALKLMERNWANKPIEKILYLTSR
jgi:hypothetical protein